MVKRKINKKGKTDNSFNDNNSNNDDDRLVLRRKNLSSSSVNINNSNIKIRGIKRNRSEGDVIVTEKNNKKKRYMTQQQQQQQQKLKKITIKQIINYKKIDKNIFITNIAQSSSTNLLIDYNIKHIISLSNDPEPKMLSKIYEELGINHIRIPIVRNNLLIHFNYAFDLLEKFISDNNQLIEDKEEYDESGEECSGSGLPNNILICDEHGIETVIPFLIGFYMKRKEPNVQKTTEYIGKKLKYYLLNNTDDNNNHITEDKIRINRSKYNNKIFDFKILPIYLQQLSIYENVLKVNYFCELTC
eukprot:TRINITY_DN933_c0_g1_i1.p1 TRINITY_DN933_c0_g1~~TRINITY_DN933_c0_g1_i1.p1  ORF type:complete len:335 (-),score=72.57 TRINITY_DN933_c0_g1_i1:24-929(-)